MKNKYRIVIDRYSGYEAQVRYWWFPLLWFECFFTNTSSTIERAEKVAENHKTRIVKYLDL